MNTCNSVDYQIELSLKHLDDELKAAEEQYLKHIESIVAKYTNKAQQLREQAFKLCEQKLLNEDSYRSNSKQTSTQTHSNSIDSNHVVKPVKMKNKLQQTSKSISASTDTIDSSGCTPKHIQKIRESLKRGQKLYKINQNNKRQIIQNSVINKYENKSRNVSTGNDEEEEDEDEDDDDDLNIIPLNSWSKKLHVLSNSNNATLHNMNTVKQSNDSLFGTTSPVQIHKDAASDTSSIAPPRNSYVESTHSRYQAQLKKNLNRLKRKRKYAEINIGNENFNKSNHAPPHKKTNINSISPRNKLLIRKSVPNLAASRKQHMINTTKSFDSKQIQKVMKHIFHSDSETESDDDL